MGKTIPAFGHSFGEGEVTKEPTCAECGAEVFVCETCGEEKTDTIKKLEHTFEEANRKEPTCTEPGEVKYVCSFCGLETIETIKMTDHTTGEWEIETKATVTSSGKKVQKCTGCGKILNEESYELSDEEYEAAYKDECKKMSYKELARDPDSVKGMLIKVTGEVIQVIEAANKDEYCVYRVDITKSSWGFYTDTIMVKYDGYGKTPRILDDDIVTFWGVYNGLTSYTTILGSTETVPLMTAEYIEIK